MTRAARRRTVAAMLLAVIMGGSRLARAAFGFDDPSWEGCSDLLALASEQFGSDRVVLTDALDWARLRPEDGVLLVHPTTPLDPEEAASFMKAGGRLAVLDDHGSGDRLLQHFKVIRRSLPGAPLQFLRGNPAFPVATPSTEPSFTATGGVHPTVVDVSSVVLNHATGLVHPDLTPVLEVRGRGEGPEHAEETVAVAIAGQVEKGRLFAVSDPSAFINSMLRFQGNRAFARGMLRYLGEGATGGQGRGRLFVLANAIEESGSFEGRTSFRKALDRRARWLGRALDDWRESGLPGWMHVALGAVCAVVLVGWAGRSFVRTHAPRRPRFARSTPIAAQGGIAGRLAVLASPSSPAELAILELRDTLVEGLGQAMGDTESRTVRERVDALRRRVGIGSGLDARVRRVTAWMDEAEAMVLEGRRPRLGRESVLETAAVVDEMLRLARGLDGTA